MHTLPELPYRHDALEPYLSRETLDYHYGKHHRAYVDKLNELVKGTDFEQVSLEALVRATRPAADRSSAVYNNAAQAWNHAFYWRCLTPQAARPATQLREALAARFGSLDDFQLQFARAAVSTFGSGWTWLVAADGGRLEIVSTANADTPLATGQVPLLACDVWEHAYYIDYRHARAEYLAAFWKLVDWSFVAANLQQVQPTSHAA
ncbi:MAG: superoxide dismutase [Pseudomonadota bacterium]